MLPKSARNAALFALAGAAVVLWANAGHGPGLSPESAGYVSAARSLVEQRALLWYDGGPLVAQPPLYPALLATAGFLTRTDPLRTAGVVNLLLYLTAVGMVGVLVAGRLRLAVLPASFGVAAAVAAFPLFFVAVMAWPDLLLVAIAAGAAVAGDSYAVKPTLKRAAVLAAVAAAASLTRYTGAAVVAWGAIVVLAYGGGRGLARIGRAGAFACAASVPLALWFAASPAVPASLSGPGAGQGVALVQNLTQALSAVLAWYAPVDQVGVWGPLAAVLLTAAAAVVVMRGDTPRGSDGRSARVSTQGALGLLYALAVVWTVKGGTGGQIGDRLLAPLVVPIAVIAAYVLDLLLRAKPAGRVTIIRKTAVVALAAGLLVWPITRTARAAYLVSQTGIGVAEQEWRESATAGYVLAHREELRALPIYSNAPDAVYLLTGLRASWTPSSGVSAGAGAPEGARQETGAWPPRGAAYVVWFSRRQLGSLLTLASLNETAGLRDLAILDDGRVLVVGAARRP